MILSAESTAFFLTYKDEVFMITLATSGANSLHISSVATSPKAAKARATMNLLLLSKSYRILYVAIINTSLPYPNNYVNPKYPIFLQLNDY